MFPAQEQPAWAVDGRDWPNREHSRFVEAGGIRWHVQVSGTGPILLLLHGTGAATHSWRDLLPLLSRHFTVVAPDLPGHGFTTMPEPDGLSLDGMARLTGALLKRLGVAPALAVGHSAGAAILIAMALGGSIHPASIVSINGALLPIRGAHVFSPLAKLMFLNPLMPRLFSWRAKSPDATRRLLEGTGSATDARGLALYERLFRRSGHVAATLGMMANWDLDRLKARFRSLDIPLLLVTSAGDKAVPPADAAIVAQSVRASRVLRLPAGGHLVHEEQPRRVAAVILDRAKTDGLFRRS